MAIAQSTLSSENIRAILYQKGYTGEVLESTTAKLAEITTTNKLSASQKGATYQTISLSTAFKGLGASIKNATTSMLTFLTTTPVGWLMIAGGALAGTIGLIDLLTTTTEEKAQALEKQKENLKDVKSSFEDINSELSELDKEIKNNIDAIKELESIPNPTWAEQEELDRLREVTKELERQKELKKDEQLNSAENLYKENKKTFEQEFESSYGNTSIDDLKGQLSSGNIGVGQLDLNNNITDMIATMQYLNEEKQKLTDTAQIREYDEQIKAISENTTGYLSSISDYKNNLLEIAKIRPLDENEQAHYDLLTQFQKAIYEFYSPATWNNLELDSVFDTKGIELTKEQLVEMARAGKLDEDILKDYPVLYKAISNGNFILEEGKTNTNAFVEEMSALVEEVKKLAITINKVPTLSVTDTITSLGEKLKPAFDSLSEAYSSIFEDGFNLDNINIVDVASGIKSELDELSELGLDVDLTSYEKLVSVLSDTKSTSDDVKSAFNDLATSITHTTISGGEDFNVLKKALDDLGVVNSTEVAFEALARNTEVLKDAGLDLTSATYEEISAFASEYVSAENLASAIQFLAYQKMLNEGMTMNSSEEVNNMIALAKQCGATTDIIADLTELELIYQEVADGTSKITKKELFDKKAAVMAKISDFDVSYDVTYKPEIDLSGLEKTKEDAEKKAKESLEKTLKVYKLEYEKGITDLDTYLNKAHNLIDDFYDKGKISAADYWNYQKEILEEEKDIRDKAIEAVTEHIDSVIDSIKEQQDLIQKQIDLLNEEADAEKRAYQIEQARYNLARLRTQRTRKLYVQDKGVIYDNDHDAIREAEDELADLELEEIIAGLEKEKDALDDSIDELEKYKESWEEIPELKDKTIKEEIAITTWGANWEEDILNNRTDALDTFKNNYINLQNAIIDAAWHSANEQNKAQASIGNGETNGSGVHIEGDDGKTHTEYEVVYEDGAETVKTFSSKSDADAYANKLSKGIPEDEPSYYVKPVQKFHNGIEGGYPDASMSKDKKLEVLEKLATEEIPLKKNEVPVIARNDELLVNTPQQNMIYHNFERMRTSMQTAPMDFRAITSGNVYNNTSSNAPNITTTIGDIHLHEVQNVDTLADDIVNKLPNKVLQKMHQR